MGMINFSDRKIHFSEFLLLNDQIAKECRQFLGSFSQTILPLPLRHDVTAICIVARLHCHLTRLNETIDCFST